MSGLQLLAPVGLLAAIGIPLVILYHMRHTTPIVRPVPTLRFWRQAMLEQTQHERFRRPPFSLLLLLHLALVALIALALTRPVTSRALGGFGSRTEPRHVIVLLDGSTSMAAAATDAGGGGTRYEAARAAAIDELDDLREGDVATVVVLGTHSTTLEATDAAGLRAVRERLDDLPLPGGRVDLNAALQLSADLLLPNLDDEVVLISDGALAVDPGVAAETGAPIRLVRVGGDTAANVAITNIATRGSTTTPGQQQLYARIANFGPQPVTAPVVIVADGIEVSRGEITVGPDGAAEEIVQDLPAGATAVTVRVETTDLLPADNQASSVLVQGDEFGLRVLLVSDVPTALQRALAVLPGAQITFMSPPEAATADLQGGYDLVVYEHTLPTGQPPDAPLLYVNPPEGGSLTTRGMMAAPVVERVRAQDPLLRGVELAGVTFGQTPVHVLDGTQTEVVGAEAGPLVYHGPVAETGQPMVVLAFDIAQSNLPQRVAFPILIANIAGQLAPSPLPAAAPLGDPLRYRPRSGAATVRIVPPAGEPVDLPVGVASVAPAADAGAVAADQGRLREIAFADTGQPGEYRVVELDMGGAELGGGRFVVNAGHPRESDLRVNAELPGALAQATASGGGEGGRAFSDIWPALVAAALILLLLEWLIALAPWRRTRRLRPSAAPIG